MPNPANDPDWLARAREAVQAVHNERQRAREALEQQNIVRGERGDVAVEQVPAPQPFPLRLRMERWEDVFEQVEANGPMKTKGKRGEELFQLILSGIREIYDVEAVIAGGAVRDFAAGVDEHKDVDVFIPVALDKFQFSLNELGWQGPFKVAGKGTYPIVEGKKEAGCMFPTTARASHVVQGCPVDLVFTADPVGPNEIGTFPVHAQRCVYTLGNGLALSPEAKEDIENKKFTIDPSITDKEKIKLVLGKVQSWCKREGYKDWKIVEPDVKEWWEAKEEIAKADAEKPKGRKVKYQSFDYWSAYWGHKILEENPKEGWAIIDA